MEESGGVRACGGGNGCFLRGGGGCFFEDKVCFRVGGGRYGWG